VKAHVPFHHLGHQSVKGPAAGSHELQHIRAFRFLGQSAFQCIDLTADSTDAQQEFLFVFCSVGHRRDSILYWSIVGKELLFLI